MENLEKELLEYLQSHLKTISLDQIQKDFGKEYESDDILTTLVKLEKQGRIFRNKKNAFSTFLLIISTTTSWKDEAKSSLFNSFPRCSSLWLKFITALFNPLKLKL